MKVKKIGALALAGVLGVTLASCGGNQEEGDSFVPTGNFVDEKAQTSVSTPTAFKSFVGESYEERTEILSLLEEYAINNHLTGLVLYEDGGYAKYNPRIEFPTKQLTDVVSVTPRYDYIVGYGFGIVEEGNIKNDLAAESNVNWKRYYHTFEPSDPASINYWDNKGSVVASYHPYVSASYFGLRLKADKTGYEWFPSLGTDKNKVEGQTRPIPLVNGKEKTDSLKQVSTTYRIYVDTDVKYATLSTKNSEFNGRKVTLEDYLTPWKELFNQSNGLLRGAENLTGPSSIKGIKEYYNATSKGADEEAWKKVGINVDTNKNGSYIDFEFNTPCTPFYAMYYLSSSLYTPLPKDFLEKVGGLKSWGTWSTDKSSSPIDTTLSTGPYVLETWNTDKEFVFKKNTLAKASTNGGENRFRIPGLHINILKGVSSDPLAAWKEYEAGKLDSVAIPKDKIKSETETPNTQVTRGSSTTKLNLNTCTQEEWEYLFGENGVVTQTKKADYYQVKPIMSNDDFLKGLSYSINREEYAKNRGVTPSNQYFSDAYLSNPEEGVSYNYTAQHKAVMDKMYGDTKYGYNYQKAVEAFKSAAKTLIQEGKYKVGDKIEIKIWWQAQSQIQSSGADLENYIEKAWKAANTGLELNVVSDAVTEWSDLYYKKAMVGQFDIAFGGISGNTQNPLNFMEVLKSDNSSGFTLNWGINTNDASVATIEYKGQKYTYDALFQAADTGAAINEDGSLGHLVDSKLYKNVLNEDGSRTIEVKYATSNVANVSKVELGAVVLCWYESDVEGGYEELKITDFKNENGVISFTVSKEIVDKWKGELSVDIVSIVTQGAGDEAITTQKINSLKTSFWELEA